MDDPSIYHKPDRLWTLAQVVGSSILGAIAGAAYPWIPRGNASLDSRVGMMIPLALVGAIAGPVLHLSRAWRRRDHVRALLGWTVAGAVSGAVLGTTGAFDAPGGVVSGLIGVALGAFLLTAGRFCWWAYLHRGEDDTRTEAEKHGQLIVFALSSLPVFVLVLIAAA